MSQKCDKEAGELTRNQKYDKKINKEIINKMT